MRKRALMIAWPLARKALQGIWDSFWEVMFEAIEYAEEEWPSASQKKKEYVEEKVLEFVNERADLNFITRQAVRLFINAMIDNVIEELEETLGEDWVDTVKDYKGDLADKIPFIN